MIRSTNIFFLIENVCKTHILWVNLILKYTLKVYQNEDLQSEFCLNNQEYFKSQIIEPLYLLAQAKHKPISHKRGRSQTTFTRRGG